MQIQSILSDWMVAILVAIMIIVTLVLLRLGVLDSIFGSPREKIEKARKEETKRWSDLYRKHLKRHSKKQPKNVKKLSAYDRIKRKYADIKKTEQ
jgi:hypothetical protein